MKAAAPKRPVRPHRRDRVAAAALAPPRPIELPQNRSSLRWVLLLFLGVALALMAAAAVPPTRLPQPVAEAVAARRTDLGLAGIAIAIGVVLSFVLLVLLA